MVTVIRPLVAPVGTVVVICVRRIHRERGRFTLLNLTAVAPVRLAPAMTTVGADRAAPGVKLVIAGVNCTVKSAALVAVPAGVVTVILPVVAPAGTVVEICVAESTVNGAATPLNFTCVAPLNLVPVMVTFAPTPPCAGTERSDRWQIRTGRPPAAQPAAMTIPTPESRSTPADSMSSAVLVRMERIWPGDECGIVGLEQRGDGAGVRRGGRRAEERVQSAVGRQRGLDAIGSGDVGFLPDRRRRWRRNSRA